MRFVLMGNGMATFWLLGITNEILATEMSEGVLRDLEPDV